MHDHYELTRRSRNQNVTDHLRRVAISYQLSAVSPATLPAGRVVLPYLRQCKRQLGTDARPKACRANRTGPAKRVRGLTAESREPRATHPQNNFEISRLYVDECLTTRNILEATTGAAGLLVIGYILLVLAFCI